MHVQWVWVQECFDGDLGLNYRPELLVGLHSVDCSRQPRMVSGQQIAVTGITGMLTIVCGIWDAKHILFGVRTSPKAVPPMSSSSWITNDSASGFFCFKTSSAEKANWRDERAAESLGRNFRYWMKTRAATYIQKAINGSICFVLAQ